MSDLLGKKAIVTGGSKGIGKAIAKDLCKKGVDVAIIARNFEIASKTAQEITSKGICKAYKCDVSKVSEIEETIKNIEKDFGMIDILVNSAGILDTSKIDTLTEEEWDRVIDINLKGTYFMMQKSLPLLYKSKNGRIINIASNAGRMGGFENGLAYTASKGGMISLTYGAARRLAPKGITVNCVAPGTIETEMSANNYDEAAHQRLLSRFPVGRMGKPNEVTSAVCYFASDDSSFTTGAVLDVNGGMFMG